ncbi:MAG: Type 1 glutamine amidotransferase-like domain-containing protein [Alphaproteobacteria bacterium]|nr:Type 1 glutamine amidotransferase-like domain-containing protein [Alphaproteobacteria bacterium]
MPGSLHILGAQHPHATAAAALDALGIDGPVAVVSAGWRHDEGELGALARALGRDLVGLPVYRWFDELEATAPELIEAWHGRQARIRAYKQAYAIELRAAMEVQERLEQRAGRDADILREEIAFAREAVRTLDARCIARLDQIRAGFPDTLAPWEHPAVAPRHARLATLLDGVQAVVMVGGHVAVLLNRMGFFGLDRLLTARHADGLPIVAWSAGAMVLTERILLFYDDPPDGAGDPHVLDRGLGLLPDLTLLPHGRQRLRTEDLDRMHRLCTRLGRRRGLLLDSGAWIERRPDGTLVDHGRTGTACIVEPDGGLCALRPGDEAEAEEAPAPSEPIDDGALLAALGRAVDAGEADAVPRFVASHRFPVCGERTATFFWWTGEPVDEVTLVHWVFGLESRIPLYRLGHTQAFYRRVELPPTARVEYKLEVRRGEQRRWLRDPLNDQQAFDPFGSNSVCAMPGYREPEWTRPDGDTRRGHLQRFVLHSDVYGQDRTVVVYLPHEYKPQKRYPLLICHDGSDYRRFAGMVDVLDVLIDRHEVMPLVVAFIDGGERNLEYGADPRQPDHVVNEVLPAVTERFGVSTDPSERGVMGASFGGVASLFTAWRHPGVFERLLLQSGSFVFTDIGHHGRSELWDPVVGFINQYRTDPGRIDARVFMSCGRFESLIAYNRALVPRMRKAGLDIRFRESDDGHNWICWRDHLRDGLTWLFPGRLWMHYD